MSAGSEIVDERAKVDDCPLKTPSDCVVMGGHVHFDERDAHAEGDAHGEGPPCEKWCRDTSDAWVPLLLNALSAYEQPHVPLSVMVDALVDEGAPGVWCRACRPEGLTSSLRQTTSGALQAGSLTVVVLSLHRDPPQDVLDEWDKTFASSSITPVTVSDILEFSTFRGYPKRFLWLHAAGMTDDGSQPLYSVYRGDSKMKTIPLNKEDTQREVLATMHDDTARRIKVLYMMTARVTGVPPAEAAAVTRALSAKPHNCYVATGGAGGSVYVFDTSSPSMGAVHVSLFPTPTDTITWHDPVSFQFAVQRDMMHNTWSYIMEITMSW